MIFLDVARTIAILLMLEGHFISTTLDLSTVNTNQLVYISWLKVRTITAPLFLMVSGLIFAYLLNSQSAQRIRNNPRIKKGLKRAVQLFAWGMVLHVSLFQMKDYFNGIFQDWVLSFHILQCIAIGLLIMVAVYLLFKWLGGKLMWYYLLAASIIISLHPSLLSLTGYFPEGAHPIIQNAIKGPYSIFPLVPWLSFILYGAALGAYLSVHSHAPKTIRLPVTLLLIGLVLNFGLNHLLYAIDGFFYTNVLSVSHLFGKMGWVLMILGALMLLLQRFQLTTHSLWVRIGQQTLVIYLLHCVVLYGAITSIGLDTYLGQSLAPGQAVLGAVVFLVFFSGVAVIVERVK